MGHEVAVAESAARHPVPAEEVAVETVGLRERNSGADHAGGSDAGDDGAAPAAIGRGARGPENSGAGERYGQGARGQPMVRREQSADAAERQVGRQQQVRPAEFQRLQPAQARQRQREGHGVQRHFLGRQEAVQVEQAVRSGGRHHQQGADDQQGRARFAVVQ